MRNNKRLLWIGALALLALVGQPALRADDGADAAKPTTLTNPVKVKDTFQYKSTLSVSAGGADVVVEQGRKYTVKEIKDNGDIVYVVADLGGKFSINGGDMDIPPGASVTLTQDKTGKIIDYKPDANDQNPYLSDTTQYLVAMVDHIILPDKPVKPGDSWKTEAKNPAAKDKKVSIKTTFVGLDKVDGMPAWKIKQTLEAETEDGSKMTSETTALLDAATGQLLQAENDVKNVPGKMGAVDWKSKLQRVKPDKADKAEAKPAAP